MVASNFIKFWIIAAFLVHLCLIKAKPNDSQSAQPDQIISDRNAQNCIETDNYKKNDVGSLEVKSIEVESPKDECIEVESSKVKSTEVESDYTEITFEHSSEVTDNYEKNDVESLEVKNIGVQSPKDECIEAESTKVESTTVKNTEVESTKVKITEVESTEVKSTEVKSTEVESDCTEITFEHSSEAPLEQDNKKESTSVISLDIFKLFEPNQPESPVQRLINTSTHVNECYSILSNMIYLPSGTDWWKVSAFLTKIYKTVKPLVSISYDLLHQFQIGMCSMDVYEELVLQKCNLIKDLLEGSYEGENDVNYNVDNEQLSEICSKLFEISEKIMNDLHSLSKDYNYNTVESLKQGLKFLPIATEKLWSLVELLCVDRLASKEEIQKEEKNIFEEITNFSSMTPSQPDNKKKEIPVISSDILKLFQSDLPERSKQSVINTIKYIKEGYLLLYSMFDGSSKQEQWTNHEFLMRIYLTLEHLTNATDDLLQQFKSNTSFVNMYGKSVLSKLENLRAVHKNNYKIHIDRHFNYNYVDTEKFKLICKTFVDISNLMMFYLDGLEKNYDSNFMERMKQCVTFLPYATKKLYNYVMLLEDNKLRSKEKILEEENNILTEFTNFHGSLNEN